MRPLVAIRRAAPFDPNFRARNALFWPLARAARAFEGYADFPPVDALVNVFDDEPPVRFVPAAPRRRRGAAIDAGALYDARITIDRTVPTRFGCWHDLMNALVWGTFPRAKKALHARQHRAVAERLTPGSRKMPSKRTPELDALALLDEGGVMVLTHGKDARDSSARETIVFGHAIYESLVLGVAPAVVAAIALPVLDVNQWSSCSREDGLMYEETDAVRAADRALAKVIEDETMLRSTSGLKRIRIADRPRAGEVG
jgi:hypothetical protein